MDFKVVFTGAFRNDLEAIVREIARHDLQAAQRLGQQIISMAENLACFPERHPRVRRRPAVRRFVVHRHWKVFYRLVAESRQVQILRCWDGRRGLNPDL